MRVRRVPPMWQFCGGVPGASRPTGKRGRLRVAPTAFSAPLGSRFALGTQKRRTPKAGGFPACLPYDMRRKMQRDRFRDCRWKDAPPLLKKGGKGGILSKALAAPVKRLCKVVTSPSQGRGVSAPRPAAWAAFCALRAKPAPKFEVILQ